MKRKIIVGTCAIGATYANYQHSSNQACFHHLGTIRGVLCDICELIYSFESMFMFKSF